MKKKFVGIIFFIIGLGFLTKLLFYSIIDIEYIIIIISVLISILIIIMSIITKKSKRKRFFLLGVISLLLSISVFLYFLFSEYLDIYKIWPVIGFFPSIGLILYYFVSQTKSPTTIIPGIFLGILSLILLLRFYGILSLNIITTLLIIIAVMVIFIGLYLILNLKLHEVFKKRNTDENNENDENKN